MFLSSSSMDETKSTLVYKKIKKKIITHYKHLRDTKNKIKILFILSLLYYTYHGQIGRGWFCSNWCRWTGHMKKHGESPADRTREKTGGWVGGADGASG